MKNLWHRQLFDANPARFVFETNSSAPEDISAEPPLLDLSADAETLAAELTSTFGPIPLGSGGSVDRVISRNLNLPRNIRSQIWEATNKVDYKFLTAEATVSGELIGGKYALVIREDDKAHTIIIDTQTGAVNLDAKDSTGNLKQAATLEEIERVKATTGVELTTQAEAIAADPIPKPLISDDETATIVSRDQSPFEQDPGSYSNNKTLEGLTRNGLEVQVAQKTSGEWLLSFRERREPASGGTIVVWESWSKPSETITIDDQEYEYYSNEISSGLSVVVRPEEITPPAPIPRTLPQILSQVTPESASTLARNSSYNLTLSSILTQNLNGENVTAEKQKVNAWLDSQSTTLGTLPALEEASDLDVKRQGESVILTIKNNQNIITLTVSPDGEGLQLTTEVETKEQARTLAQMLEQAESSSQTLDTSTTPETFITNLLTENSAENLTDQETALVKELFNTHSDKLENAKNILPAGTEVDIVTVQIHSQPSKPKEVIVRFRHESFNKLEYHLVQQLETAVISENAVTYEKLAQQVSAEKMKADFVEQLYRAYLGNNGGFDSGILTNLLMSAIFDQNNKINDLIADLKAENELYADLEFSAEDFNQFLDERFSGIQSLKETLAEAQPNSIQEFQRVFAEATASTEGEYLWLGGGAETAEDTQSAGNLALKNTKGMVLPPLLFSISWGRDYERITTTEQAKNNAKLRESVLQNWLKLKQHNYADNSKGFQQLEHVVRTIAAEQEVSLDTLDINYDYFYNIFEKWFEGTAEDVGTSMDRVKSILEDESRSSLQKIDAIFHELNIAQMALKEEFTEEYDGWGVDGIFRGKLPARIKFIPASWPLLYKSEDRAIVDTGEKLVAYQVGDFHEWEKVGEETDRSEVRRLVRSHLIQENSYSFFSKRSPSTLAEKFRATSEMMSAIDKQLKSKQVGWTNRSAASLLGTAYRTQFEEGLARYNRLGNHMTFLKDAQEIAEWTDTAAAQNIEGQEAHHQYNKTTAYGISDLDLAVLYKWYQDNHRKHENNESSTDDPGTGRPQPDPIDPIPEPDPVDPIPEPDPLM